MTNERYEQINKVGDIDELVSEIVKDTRCTVNFVKDVLPRTLSILTEKQRTIFLLYYYNKKNIYNIRYMLGSNSFQDIEKPLYASISKIKKEIKKIYREE